jgi:hypothetical protein
MAVAEQGDDARRARRAEPTQGLLFPVRFTATSADAGTIEFGLAETLSGFRSLCPIDPIEL